MSMQVVYGLIHAAHQLQSQLSLPILMPATTWTCHVCCAGGQTANGAGQLSRQILGNHQQQTGSYSGLYEVSESVSLHPASCKCKLRHANVGHK